MNIYFYSYKSVPESYKAVAPWDHAEIDISRLSAGTTYMALGLVRLLQPFLATVYFHQ